MQSLSFNKPIVDITIKDLSKYLLISDENSTIYILDIETLKLKNKIELKILQNAQPNRVLDFSSNLSYVVFASQKVSKLFSLKQKEVVAVMERHRDDVSCVAIDPNDRYFFSGGDDGFVYGVDIRSKQLALVLPKHTDSINDIVFSKDARFVATASYDKVIHLYDLEEMALKKKLRSHTSPIMKMLFLTKTRLLSIDKDGGAIVWDLENFIVVTRLGGFHDEVTSVCLADNLFIFIATKLGYVMAYDLHTYRQISHSYIKVDAKIDAIGFDQIRKNLYLGCNNSRVYVENIYKHKNEIAPLMQNLEYSEVYKITQKNILLGYTKEYQQLELLWQKSIDKARELLEKLDKDTAFKVVQPFLSISSKKAQFQKLLDDFLEYEKFVSFVKQNKLSLAYSMIGTHEIFKETKIYKLLEQKWQDSLVEATKVSEMQNSVDKIKEIFAPYRGIAQKSAVIQDIIQNYTMLNRFKLLIYEKKFKLAFELSKKYNFLESLGEYKNTLIYLDSLLINANNMQDANETLQALKIYKNLVEIDEYKDIAREQITKIENGIKFENAIKDDNLEIAYNLLDNCDKLKETQNGKLLDKQWQDDKSRATIYISKADAIGLKNLLLKYINIKSKLSAIASMTSWCYIVELNRTLRDSPNQKILENGIKNFLLYFGQTEEFNNFFEHFLKIFPQTKLNPSSLPHGSLDGWKSSMVVKSILE